MQAFAQRIPASAPLIVLLLVLVVHGQLVLTDARFLDGTFLEYYIETGRWQIIAQNFYATAMPPWAWMMGLLAESDHPGLLMRSLELASLAVIGICVERSARRHFGISPSQSLLLALLTVLFPAYGAAMMSSTVIYLFPMALFYLGWMLYLDGDFGQRQRWCYTLSAVAIWWLAFFHNSLLAFQYGMLVILLAYSLAATSGDASLPRRLADFSRRHAVPLSLPVIFFIFRTLLIRFGDPGYTDYNQIVFAPMRNFHAFAGGFYHHVVLNLSAALMGSLAALALLLAFLVARLARSGLRNADSRGTAMLFALGLLLSVLAIFPYAAVGKAAPLQSFGARYGMLSGLGGAMILLAAWRTLPGTAVFKLAAALVFLSGLSWRSVGDDLMWLGRWAKDRGVLIALAANPAPRPGTVLVLQDSWPIGNETYRPFELSWFFATAWSGERWGGFDARERGLEWARERIVPTPSQRAREILQDFMPNGCLRTIEIAASNPEVDPRRLGLRYLVDYFTLDKSELERRLDALVDLKIGPEDCKALADYVKSEEERAN